MKQLEGLIESDIIFYDIETCRGEKVLEQGTPVYDAWAYKARYQNELNKKTGQEFTVEEYYYEKAPLYAPFGKVAVIVVGRIRNNKLYLKSYASYDESELLKSFNSDLEAVYQNNPKVRFCSFNGVGFDTPYLEKRLIINGIKPCSLISEGHLEPWKVTQIDLAKTWKGNAFYPDSLLAVATALGLPSPKDALDGSMVSEAFYEGRLQEIERYCLKDVETTARIFRKLSFKEDLEESFEIIGQALPEKELSLLEKIYQLNSFSADIKQQLEKTLKKKKLTDKDKNGLYTIIRGVYVRCDFVSGDQDSKKEIERKETEIQEWLKTL